MKVTNPITNISNSNQISVCEYPDCIAINGQCFNKNTFEVQPLKFRNSFGNQILSKQIRKYNGILNPSTTWYSYSIHNPEPNCTEFIKDKYNSNSFYLIESSLIHKINIDNEDKIEYINIAGPTLYYTSYMYKYLEQDENFIYFIAEGIRTYPWNTTNVINMDNNKYNTSLVRNGLHIIKINKNDNTYAYITIERKYYHDDWYNNGIQQRINDTYKLHSNNNNIYILVLSSSEYNNAENNPYINHTNTWYKIYKINRNTNELIFIDSIQKTDNTQQCRCNPIKINNNYYFIEYIYSESGSKYVFKKIILDTKKDKVTFSNINIKNCTVPTNVLEYTTSYNIIALDLPCFSLYKITNQYILLAIHMNGPVACAAGISFYGFYLLKVSDNQTEFMEITNEKFNKLTYGILQIDIYTYVVIFDDCVNFYYIDIINNKIILLYSKTGNFYTVSIDETKRLYFFTLNNNTSQKLEIVTKNSIIDIFTEFEQDSYIFTGEDISTKLFFYGKNYLDKYQIGKIRITLSDNCVFKSTNTKSIIVYTKNEISSLDVIIKNSGEIFATTEVMEVI